MIATEHTESTENMSCFMAPRVARALQSFLSVFSVCSVAIV